MRRLHLTASLRLAAVRETVAAVLLLALLLQAAIPVGFMPGAVGSSVVQLCAGWAPYQPAHAGPFRGPDSGAPTHGRPEHHGALLCPFAAATPQGAIGPWVVNLTGSFAAVLLTVPEACCSEAARPGPRRAQQPRAPPISHS
jgi:hypothetical protein